MVSELGTALYTIADKSSDEFDVLYCFSQVGSQNYFTTRDIF